MNPLAVQLQRIHALLDAGDFGRAGAEADALVRAAPGWAAAWSALSEAALGIGRFDLAAETAERALVLQPESLPRRAHAARCVLMNGDPVRARVLAEDVWAKLSGHDAAAARVDADSLDTLATVFERLGSEHRALTLYRRAVDAAPDAPRMLFNLGTSLANAGQVDEAEAVFRRLLELTPDDAEALHSLVLLRRQTESDQMVERLQHAAARARHWQQAARLDYALGKTLADLDRHAEAFAAYRRGAERVDAALPEALKQDAEALDAARAALPRMLEQPPADEQEEAGSPLFIVGLPRSGSTLLERMLGAHPGLVAAGELTAFGDALREQLGPGDRVAHLQALAAGSALPDPARLAASYRTRLATRELAPGLPIDKMPINLLWVPLIHRALPRARFLVTRRDPMDTGLALYTTLFVTGYFSTFDLGRIARLLRAFDALLEALQRALPEAVLRVVDYEALVEDPAARLRELLDFLGLDWDARCLEFHRGDAAVRTASAQQVREPVHRRSVGRWRRYEKELEPLRQALQAPSE